MKHSRSAQIRRGLGIVAIIFGITASSELMTRLVAQQAPSLFTIDTVAGSGSPDVGDGRSAREAVLEFPSGVLAASDGSVYVVDTNNDRVRRVTVDGMITTIAGTGSGETRDFGDGLPATQAQLRLPRSVKLAPDGSLWIVDTNNYRIRRITSDGIMQTVAGGGGANDNPRDDVPALGAQFGAPMDIAFDTDGNYYIADFSANRIRRVGADGIIRMLAQVNGPRSLASDGRGGIVIATVDGGPLKRFNLATGAISSIDGAQGQFVTVDEGGNIFFVSGNQVFRWDARSGTVTLIAGRSGPAAFDGDGGPATSATLSSPQRLSIGAGGMLYICDSGNDRVRQVSPDGRIDTLAGSGRIPGDDVPSLQAVIYDSQGIAIDPHSSVFFTDSLHATIRKIDERQVVRTVAGGRRNTDQRDDIHPLSASIGSPTKLVFDRQGNLLVLDENGSTGVIRVITPGADGVIDGSPDERIRTIAGQYRPRREADRGRADGGPARNAVFDAARAIALDSQGRLYIADVFDNRIRMVAPGSDGVFNGGSDEIITTIAGTGTAVSSGDGGPARSASLSSPGAYGSLAVDGRDNIYVIENKTRVRQIDGRTGIIQTIWNNGQNQVWSIAFDSANWAYITDSTRIRRFQPDSTSTIETVAGTGQAGFSGDGGAATQASMAGAQFMAIDSRGDLHFPDNGNFRIRRLQRP